MENSHSFLFCSFQIGTMRLTLCLLVLLLIVVALANPEYDLLGDRKGKKKNKKNKKNKDKSGGSSGGKSKDDEDGHTQLKCLNGGMSNLSTKLNICETAMSENCIEMYIAGNKDLILDNSQHIYGCKRPGFTCKSLQGFIETAPEGSYCKECDRKYNGCNNKAMYDKMNNE